MSTAAFIEYLTNPADLDDEPIPSLKETTMGTLSMYPSMALGGKWHAVTQVIADGTAYCQRTVRPDTLAVPITVSSPDEDTILMSPDDVERICTRCVELWAENRWT